MFKIAKRALGAVEPFEYLPSDAQLTVGSAATLGSGGKPYFIMMDSKFKDDYMCLPFLDRVPLTVKSDIDPNTDANVFKGRARFMAGFNNWRCISICGEGVNGTTITAPVTSQNVTVVNTEEKPVNTKEVGAGG